MWKITSFDAPGATQLYACDGEPALNYERDTPGVLIRIVVAPYGYLDFSYTEQHNGGLIYNLLMINGLQLVCGAVCELQIEVEPSGGFSVNQNGAEVQGALQPLPVLTGETIEAFREMIRLKIVPYQDPPSGTPKSDAELQALADSYFPGNPFGFDLAMSLYDWTSASFIRQDLFHQLEYTGVEGKPLDLPTIARVIWGCNYPGYTAQDANFMNQFMMQPANSEQDVSAQLQTVYAKVKPLAAAEMDVFANAVLSLPPVSVADYPQLYRGAMPMSGGYDTGDFSPSMFEYPGNNGPTTTPLYQALSDALNGCLATGNVITTKGPWSFSNDLEGAKVWQNGILITLNPPPGATIWPGSADITGFSLNPGTFEINMPPPSRYRIDGYEWTTINDKPVCHFTMTHLGYCVEPL
ncbi:hypothetical protein [Coraliomargarita parva]|uniref:hypothetical protein n=1 Tax=Coraliomargarita parva TaxID=3014050 RepID=UPI0022B47908|nr:hypothetical protein [Coraliomargarita parva]